MIIVHSALSFVSRYRVRLSIVDRDLSTAILLLNCTKRCKFYSFVSDYANLKKDKLVLKIQTRKNFKSKNIHTSIKRIFRIVFFPSVLFATQEFFDSLPFNRIKAK